VLEALKPDVFLAQHPDLFRLEEKLQKARAGPTPNPFVDPDGYRKAVEAAEAAYLDQLRRERGQSH
jgi:hypothetical protein